MGIHILSKSLDQYVLKLVLGDATLTLALRLFNSLTAMQKDLNAEISRPLSVLCSGGLVWLLVWVLHLLNDSMGEYEPAWISIVQIGLLGLGLVIFTDLMLATSRKAEMLPH